jgi:hypothetical protein
MHDLNRNPQQEGEAARSLNLAGDGRLAPGSAGLWEIISRGTSDAGEFYSAWLGLQCGMVGGVTAGLLLLRNKPHPDVPPFSPAAAWPDAQRDLNQLAQAAQQAAGERRSVVARCHSGTLADRDHGGASDRFWRRRTVCDYRGFGRTATGPRSASGGAATGLGRGLA